MQINRTIAMGTPPPHRWPSTTAASGRGRRVYKTRKRFESTAENKVDVWLILAIFGMSLFSMEWYVGGLSATIAYADGVVGLLLVYSLIHIRRYLPSAISYATLGLAVAILLSGIVNTWSDATFDVPNFLINYVRVIAIVAMVFLLPPLVSKIGHDRVARSTMWVIRLQCLLILADSVSLLPSALSPSADWLERPTGLFGEPGWFGVWIGLSVFYVIQVQRNHNRRYMGPLDIGLLGISVIASTGVRGVVLVGVAMALMVVWMGMRTRLRLFAGLFLTLLLLVSASSVFPGTGPAWGWGWVTTEGRSELSINLMKDERLHGTLGMVNAMLVEETFLGTGLGGDNEARLASRYTDVAAKAQTPLVTKMMLSSVLVAGGLFALVPFLFILARMVVSPHARWMGVGFAAVALIWGGAFETFIWWYVVLAVALVDTRKERAATVSHPTERLTTGGPTVVNEAT